MSLILIIDDDKQLSLSFTKILTQDGYDINCSITVTGPPEGMKHTKTVIFSSLMRSAEFQ